MRGGVELGIGRAASVAPTLGRGATLGARIGGFPAPKFEKGIRNIANPFKAEEKVREFRGFSVASVIAEAENIVKARKILSLPQILVKTPEPLLWTPVRPLRKVVEAMPQVRVKPATESKPANSPRIASKPAPLEARLEQIVEEKIMTKQDKEKKNTKLRERASILRVKFVEAIHISELRRAEIKLAVKKAKAEVGRLGLKGITGRLVRQLLGDSFWILKSPIVGEGKDGTIPLTAALVEADQTRYSSSEDAEKGFVQAVDKHIPIKQGVGGRVATIEEVREVIEGTEKEVIHSQTAAEIVVKRVIKLSESVGQERVVSDEVRVENSETSLKDFPQIRDLFQKAA